MGGRVCDALSHNATRIVVAATAPAAGECECSYPWIWSRWCMLGREDQPGVLDAWAVLLWA